MEIDSIGIDNGSTTRLRRRLEQLSSQTSHCIHRVPRLLRDVNNKAYDPKMVAIGPYHHGKDEFKMMQDLKLRCMKSLLDRKPDIRIEDYCLAIAEMEKRARDCYADPIHLDASEFTEMLVLDGCFIIELMRPEGEIQKKRTFVCLHFDFLLLENQIPFFVLCKLFDLIEGPGQHRLLMQRILFLNINIFPGYMLYEDTTMRRPEEVDHILDLVHSNWCPPGSDPNIVIPERGDVITGVKDEEESILSIPSAAQLKDANVKFEKKEYGCIDWVKFREKNTTIFDVEFKKGGVMLMPTLVIDCYTETTLRNLIAFEQYLPIGEPARITDYALLLDGLINSAQDVQILSRYGIIRSILGSDQKVVDFVNRLTENVVYFPMDFQYSDIILRLKEHHKKPWNRAVAVLRRDYFNSPWAYLSVSAAVVLLLLTVAQTFFAARG